MRARIAILMAGLAAGGPVLACGGDGAGLGPPPASIAGDWAFSISNLRATVNGITVVCSTTGTTLTFTQAGTAIGGSYVGGTMTCAAQGRSSSTGFGSGTVLHGTYSGSQISFDLDTTAAHFTGTVGASQMSGATTFTFDLGPPEGVVVMRGSWRAVR